MANEVTVTTLLGNQGDPVEYTIAEGSLGTNIPKGSVMNINSSPQTVTVGAADELVAGVLAAEHKGGTGVTKVSVLTHFIGEITAGTGATNAGYPQKLSGANLWINADDDTTDNKAEAGCVSLETVADGNQGAAIFNIG